MMNMYQKKLERLYKYVKYSDVNALLTQAEQLYFGGDFKKSTELALEAINKVSLKDGVKS